LASTFVLGYHGCDEAIAEKALSGLSMEQSKNDYDWLGTGVYFWEANPRRGLEWARERSDIANPSVVGAVIDLGLCLDLTASDAFDALRTAHAALVATYSAAGWKMPMNKGGSRKLDCAVINLLHDIRASERLESIKTVRGVFTEGDPVYETANFRNRTHIQIAVRDNSCIKGVFRVPHEHLA